ncbi:MAG: hypothetical protein HZB16_13030, partial [Armatimonadetes bacterium]|nr:hypothetical protein [Armatimonadota bacterium]
VRADSKPHVIIVPGVPSLRGARAFRFWLRTDATTMMALLVQEKGGARYITAFSSQANRWQQVEVSPDRLRLDDESKDANDQLDLDSVDAFGLVDLCGAFPMTQRVLGQHRLWVDDWRVDKDEAPTAYSAKHTLPYLLDDFQADYVSWLAPVGTLTHDPAAGELVWRYPAKAPEGAFVALLTILGQLPAEGAANLVLTLSSRESRVLIVALQEEKRPGRPERSFVSILPLRGGDEQETLVLPLAKFQLDDKKDKPQPGPMHVDRVSRLVLADLDCMSNRAANENALRLNEVMLTP